MVDSLALGAPLGRAPRPPGHPFALVVLCPTMPSPSQVTPVLSSQQNPGTLWRAFPGAVESRLGPRKPGTA